MDDATKAKLFFLNEEILDRLVKASALVQALGAVRENRLNSQVVDEYVSALEAIITEARQLQMRFWQEFTGAVE